LPKFYGGAVGYLSYDMVRHFENLPDANPDPLELPEAYFIFSDTVLIFDHALRTLKIVANTHVDGEDPDRAYDEALGRIGQVLDRLAAHPNAATPVLALSGKGGDAAQPPKLISNFERSE